MMRIRPSVLAAGFALAAAAPLCAQAALLAPERIAALPDGERRAWEAYLETSRRQMEADRAALATELRAIGRAEPIPTPSAPNFAVTPRMTDAWFAGDEARRVAESILSYQTPSGGWSKHVDHAAGPRVPGQGYAVGGPWHYVGTFDNGATTEHLRFLARVDRVRSDARYRQAYLRGLEYVLRAQFPNGCWPQVYPLEGGYHDAATFNDDATVNVLRLLRDAARGEPAFVPADLRTRAADAVGRGIECILAAQPVVDGRRVVWGAQHDPLTLAPVGARSFEPAALSGKEGPALAAFLMDLDADDPRVAIAIFGAAYRKKLRKKNQPLALAWVRKELARIVYYVLRDGTDYDNTFRGVALSRPKKA